MIPQTYINSIRIVITTISQKGVHSIYPFSPLFPIFIHLQIYITLLHKFHNKSCLFRFHTSITYSYWDGWIISITTLDLNFAWRNRSKVVRHRLTSICRRIGVLHISATFSSFLNTFHLFTIFYFHAYVLTLLYDFMYLMFFVSSFYLWPTFIESKFCTLYILIFGVLCYAFTLII